MTLFARLHKFLEMPSSNVTYIEWLMCIYGGLIHNLSWVMTINVIDDERLKMVTYCILIYELYEKI